MMMRNPFSAHTRLTSTARQPSRLGALILHALPIALAVLFSLAIFILEQTALSLLRTNNHSRQVSLSFNPEAESVTVRLSIDRLPTSLIMGTTIVASLFSLISAVACWELRNRRVYSMTETRQRLWLAVNGFATISVLSAVVSSLGVVFAREKESKSRFGTAIPQDGAIMEATLETWLCKLHELDSQAGWAKYGCGVAAAGRWLLVPLGICASAIVLLCAARCWEVVRGEPRIVEKEIHILATKFGVAV